MLTAQSQDRAARQPSQRRPLAWLVRWFLTTSVWKEIRHGHTSSSGFGRRAIVENFAQSLAACFTCNNHDSQAHRGTQLHDAHSPRLGSIHRDWVIGADKAPAAA